MLNVSGLDIDFDTLQALDTPDGKVIRIDDAAGNVLWAMPSGVDKVILEVEKITSDTYAGGTTYTGEQFILLDIYPKTNGTVNVTYGGLTKTITDTSGAAEPNAQQVFFGTFNGVSDEVETPASGTLTIEGDYYAFGCGVYNLNSKTESSYTGVIVIQNIGQPSIIPDEAFTSCTFITAVKLTNSILSIGAISFSGCAISEIYIPSSVESIGDQAFYSNPVSSLVLCHGLKSIGEYAFGGDLSNRLSTAVEIPASVENIGDNPFYMRTGKNIISVHKENKTYKIDGNCLIEVATNRLISGFEDSVIPSYITRIGKGAFAYQRALQSITIPENVPTIGDSAFVACEGLIEVVILAEVPPVYEYKTSSIFSGCTNLVRIVVPAGCGEAYKTAEYWKTYADYIVEAS